MQPVFNVNGNKFIYTSEQTSFFKGSPIQSADTILKGNFRTSSIDSILILVSGIKDSLIYRTNPDIMSGGIQYIIISKEKFSLEFDLFNASDPTAQKIVDILNTYIPNEERKLYLMDISDYEKKIAH
jgi:hypothetical protein